MGDSTMLRLAYVSDTMTSMQMLEGLAERFDLTLIHPASLGDRPTNWWPPRADLTIDRVTIPGGRLAFVARVSRWLARHRHEFDVVVALDALVGALGATLGRRRGGPPVVLQVGRPTLEYIRCQRGHRSRASIALRLATAHGLIGYNERRAAAIGTVSEYVAALSRRHNAHVAPIAWQGVDTSRFGPICSQEDARHRLGLPTDAPIVMWRSRLAPEKDPVTFLRAIAVLRSEGRRVTALYMGGEIAEMAALADDLGVELVCGNAATADEIPLWYVAADVAVQTSRAEGLGLSVSEAMACETPVVVSNAGGLPETVGFGEHGAVVPARDAAATAAAIARLLDDPVEAAKEARGARRFVEEHYERSRAFDAWETLIRAAVASPSHARPRTA